MGNPRSEVPPPEKEQLAGGNKAAGEWLRQAQPNAVGKHQRVKRFVKRVLAEELGEICAGAKRRRRDAQR